MKYLEVTFTTHPCNETVNDVVSALAGEIGFESFVECEGGIQAYIQQTLFDEEALKEMVANFPLPDTRIEYTIKEAEDKNWNEEWEKHFFKPIIIDNRCIIHSSFHRDIPKLEYDIIIDPKMAFGTGHHETTSLMVSEILKMDLSGKTVLDMGCGTSVLAILASMKGASAITAIDIDDWCVENSLENIALNGVNNIQVLLGDASLLRGMHFDVIIANINRNILLNDMAAYSHCLSEGGCLYMSGFYTEDVSIIESGAVKHGLKMDYFNQKNNWAAVKMTK